MTWRRWARSTTPRGRCAGERGQLVDVPLIVLGGHLREIAPLLRPALETTLRARVLSARWESPRVELADDEPAPGARGTALRELERLVAESHAWLT